MKKYTFLPIILALTILSCKTKQTVVEHPGTKVQDSITETKIIAEANEDLPVTDASSVFKLGIEVLQEIDFAPLQGKRVGLVTNPTGVNQQLKSTIDILFESNQVNLVALFGPEHGVRGNFAAGDQVGNQTDAKTGLPVFSLYGKGKKPNKAAMDLVDVLVYDIQDIGVRSYTYISTMGLIMEAAADFGKEVIILDRPNPLGGERVEGMLVQDGFYSFVSQFKIPYVYGLTCGELARMLNFEGLLPNVKKCNLQVIPMQGYTRDMTFNETGLLWVPTSPHIPHAENAFYYAATGIIGELDPNMVGIGYTLPFQTLVTENVNADKLANAMNSLKLDGIIFRPIYLKPFYMEKKDKELQGVQIHITDFKMVNLTDIQFYFLQEAHKIDPKFNPFKGKDDRFRMFDFGCGSDEIRKILIKNFSFETVKIIWEKDAKAFKELSKKYYLY